MSNPNNKQIKMIIFISWIITIIIGCSETSEIDRLRQYLASINASGVSATASAPNSHPIPHQSDAMGIANLPNLGGGGGGQPGPPATAIIGGTPRQPREGFCGDGIINGPNEDCDQGAIQNTACADYNGTSGVVTCQQNCLYDMSDCITPAVDTKIGGSAETCNCNCTTSFCKGGCITTGITGQSSCIHVCDNGCDCLCGKRQQAKLERFEFRCGCIVSADGTPNCTCNADSAQLTVTLVKHLSVTAGLP